MRLIAKEQKKCGKNQLPHYKMVIEIDGGYHDTPEQKEADRKRQEWLEKNGLRRED